MSDSSKYQTSRARPLQDRSRERVRVILSAALGLFKEHGIETVTTNDIAKAANIPIGSLYRYFPDKDAIISSLVSLYITDLTRILKEIGAHPMLPYMSWNEILLIMADAWVNYARLNHNYALLYAVRANPHLRAQNRQALQRFSQLYYETLTKRCPEMAKRDAIVYLQLIHAAVDLALNMPEPGPNEVPVHHLAMEILAGHLNKACLPHDHS